MSYTRVDLVDEAAWQWIKGITNDLKSLKAGSLGTQSEGNQAHQTLQERLMLTDSQLLDHQHQLSKLPDLYLAGEFPKGMLTERKARQEKCVAELQKEQSDVSNHLKSVIVTDEQIAYMEAFCAEVRNGLDEATFEDKR